LDWGTRRKPLGAIVAWGSLAVFAVLSILGIAGVVMGLQHKPAPASTQVEVAALEPAPPVEERLPEEMSFGEAQASDPTAEPAAVAPAVAIAESSPVSDQGNDMIASTFEQLVEPVTLPASQLPEGAIVPDAQPTTVVADATGQLPVSNDNKAPVPPASSIGRNAAAWAIESEVPDGRRTTTAFGYAAQPDDTVRVGDSSINVRSAPSPGSKRLFALAAGTEVDVTGKASGKSGNWVAITDGKDRDGWVDASLLDNVDLGDVPLVKNPPTVEAAAPAKPSSLKKVASSGVTVRSGPGKSNKSLFNLSGGSAVTVLDDSKGWLKIKDAQGRTGWAYQSYIKG